MLDIRELVIGRPIRMNHNHRFTSVPVIHQESSATHSFYVAYYTMLIAEDLTTSFGCELDYRKMFVASIVHDNDEAITGDILRRMKYSVPGLKKILNDYSFSVMQSMSKVLGVDIHQQWLDAKDSSVEGRIVMLADLLSVINFVYTEVMLGNKFAEYIVDELRHTMTLTLKTLDSKACSTDHEKSAIERLKSYTCKAIGILNSLPSRDAHDFLIFPDEEVSLTTPFQDEQPPSTT